MYSREKENRKKIIELVKQKRVLMTRIGTKKVYFLIKPDIVMMGIRCGRDKLHSILKQEGMLIKKKKNYMRTTNSYHKFYKHPNLIKDIHINRAEQVWVSDITYIRTHQGWLYLSLITDAYSKQIVGHQLSDNMRTVNSINALKIAIKNRKYPERPLIHHSDRGFQYCNPDYTETLDKNNIGISMTTKHDPYENAVAERVNGTLKNEFDLGDHLPDQKNAERELNKTVWVYNNLRPHESCSYLTPVQAHNQESIEIKKWPVRFRKKQDQNILTLNQLCHT
jgi:transposase InsO family protein